MADYSARIPCLNFENYDSFANQFLPMIGDLALKLVKTFRKLVIVFVRTISCQNTSFNALPQYNIYCSIEFTIIFRIRSKHKYQP